MARLLQIQVRDPDQKVGRDALPVRGVTVEAGPPPEDTEDQRGDLDPAAELGLTVHEVGLGAFEVELPEGRHLVVRLKRTGFHPLQLSLDLGPPAHFRHRQPLICRLGRAGASQSGSDAVHRTLLTVDWHAAPQELLMATGRDSMFHPGAARRQAWLLGKERVHRGCVLTQYKFESSPKKDPTTFELTRETLLIGALQTRPALMTREVLSKTEDVSVTTVYEHLARIGRERPGSVHELGFLNHAYWIGPVLVNTGRPGYGCYDACPTHGGRHKNSLCEVPKQVVEHRRWRGEPEPKADSPVVKVGVIHRELSVGEGEQHWSNFPDDDLGHQRTFDRTVPRDPKLLDRDCRNTDFCHDRMPVKAGDPNGAPTLISIAEMRAALHPDATLRVWGCSNGSMGGLWRQAFQESRAQESRGQTSRNRMLRVRSFHEHGDETDLHTWEVRQGDFELMYLSNLRRSYGQSLATALGRPCFAAVPGTWAWFKALHKTGALTVHTGVHRAIAPLARRLGKLEEPDPGGFYRLDPDYHVTARGLKHEVELTVLVTGFVPFRARGRPQFPDTNGSARTVQRIKAFNIDWLTERPPWIDFKLNLVKQPAVDVAWTCPAARSHRPPEQEATNRPEFALKGAQGILEEAQRIDADIVVIVGEAAAMARPNREGKIQHLRVELFARNQGSGFDPEHPLVDNDGFALDQPGPIFPGDPDVLRTTVPLRGWALAKARLKNIRGVNIEDFTDRDPVSSAGAFICNESYYTLLREAQSSGRWVSMVHVPATELWEDGRRRRWLVEGDWTEERERVTHALERTITSFCEHMLWATEVYGRLENDEARARLRELRG